MSFTVKTMLGNKALVSGTDVAGNSGQTIVSTAQWDDLNGRSNFSKAQADFDAAVEEFFAPLTEATEKLADAVAGKSKDSAEYIVLTEATEGVAAKPAQVVALTTDSIILRLIGEGQTDRLVWVDESTLGVLAA